MRARSARTGALAKIKATPLAVPAFKSEAEEAEWWDTHTAEVDAFIRRAEKAGAVTRGTVARSLTRTRITTMRMPSDLIERARVLAQRKGLRYQTYLKMILIEAIDRAERAG